MSKTALSEQIIAGLRKANERLGEERRTEWIRAENAEATVTRLTAANKALVEALRETMWAMLNHAGWNHNFDPSGKELPMSRPDDVAKAEEKARSLLAAQTTQDKGTM